MKVVLGLVVSLISTCALSLVQDKDNAGGTASSEEGSQKSAFSNFADAIIGLFTKNEERTKDSNVATTLIGLFNNDIERTKDLTAVDELVRGLTFDQYEEKVSCRVANGILLKDYPTIVDNFARRFSIPEDTKISLFEGTMMKDLVENVRNFKFEKGKTGSYVYGRVATIKRGNKIDIAYSVYTLEFKFSQTVLEHRQKTKFLWFTTGEKVWHERKERNLDLKEKDAIENAFMMKAIAKFRAEYGGMIESSQYCDAYGNCK